jgi:hypothetical protein
MSDEGAMNETLKALAFSVRELALAVRQQSAVLEVLQEAMPATTEAKLLGVSERTIRRQRKRRKDARLMVTGV